MTEARAWGVIPDGFRKIADGRGTRLVVREDRADEIDLNIFRDTDNSPNSHHQGRAPLRALRLRDGTTALIRSYRHGGLLRALTGTLFASWPPRPFRELTITEELRRRGFPTVEVYAAAIERIYGPFYRGCLVTRELTGARDLWAVLQDPAMDEARRTNVLKAAADAIVAMHRQGICHADLNLRNILIRSDRDVVKGYVIDFDRAQLYLGELPVPLARNNLNRLLRSARKLDPQRRYLSAAGWNQLLDFYYGAARD